MVALGSSDQKVCDGGMEIIFGTCIALCGGKLASTIHSLHILDIVHVIGRLCLSVAPYTCASGAKVPKKPWGPRG